MDRPEPHEKFAEETIEAIEPKLKYERIIKDVPTVLTEHGISCLTAHSKFLCVGTNWGSIHFLDFEGNIVNNQLLRPHNVPVNQISVGHGGEFVATCANDGNVIIYDLSQMQETAQTPVLKLSLGRSVSFVAIDPLFCRSGQHPYFVTGNDRLMIHQRKLLGRSKSTVLYNGVVYNTRWNKHFVAWTSDVGIHVYDSGARCLLEPVEWDRENMTTALSSLYRCNLTWTDNRDRSTLLVGWVDTVRLCGLKQQPKRLRDDPSHIIELLLEFRIDYFVSGIGLLNDSQLVILCCSKEKDKHEKPTKSKMCVFEARESSYVEMYGDNLTLRDFQNYGCNDYVLESLVEENLFVIVSAKDIVVAYPYDIDDRIEWLLDHNKHTDAMDIVNSTKLVLRRNSKISVGKKFSDYLFSKRNYAEAGKLTAELCGDDKYLWQEEIIKFEEVQQLRQLSNYVPTTGKVILDSTFYEKILYEYLNEEPKGFLNLIKQWPSSLYDISAVKNELNNHLSLNSSSELLEALAILFTYSGKFHEALKIYLHINHKATFELITKYNLYPLINDIVEDLMRLDCNQAIQILLRTDKLPIDKVMAKLKNNKRYLYMYLDALTREDPRMLAKYDLYDDLILLYSEFAPKKLLLLLTQNDNYSMGKALDVCKRRKYYPEMAYLLGRMGDNKEKLNLVVNKLFDIHQAIEICRSQNESYLWHYLVDLSIDKPEFLMVLLQRMGTYTDPTILIHKIQRNTFIPDLKNTIADMITGCKLQVPLEVEHTKIVVNECFQLLEKYHNEMKKGWGIHQYHVCNACNKYIVGHDRVSKAYMFHCRHMFHEECVETGSKPIECLICINSQVKLKTSKLSVKYNNQ